jgi:hypothetical protein
MGSEGCGEEYRSCKGGDHDGMEGVTNNVMVVGVGWKLHRFVLGNGEVDGSGNNEVCLRKERSAERDTRMVNGKEGVCSINKIGGIKL